MRKTKIVCTIGPASNTKETFRKLVKNGLNVARLNFSHGDHQSHENTMNTIKEVREELNVPVAILLDTKGPEIRTGKIDKEEIHLEEGNKITLTTKQIVGDENILHISYEGLPKDVELGDKILIDDGLVELEIEEIKDTDIICKVLNGGIIKDHKGVNVPGVKINLPALTEKDILDIKFGIRMNIDFIAASFVRKASDVLEIRKLLEDNHAEHIQIISKIENEEGVDNLEEIIEISDGVMVARGDLGVEIATEEVPLVQKEIIKQCNRVGKPVITATQMLDSMIRNPRPTRAEVTDIANAILDGTDAIMLSGETASGKYPAQAVQTMSDIAKRTELAIDYRGLLRHKVIDKETTVTDGMSYATCSTALDLSASAIITATSSGYTARMVSKFRPQAPIIATTAQETVRRRLSLVWGVESILTQHLNTTDDVINMSVKKSLEKDLIKKGDLVVITAGVPVGISGTTNLLKVHIVGDVLLSGAGIGKGAHTGRAFVVDYSNNNPKGFEEGDILITHATSKELIDIVEQAGAIITEEGGLTSHGAIVGLNLGIPTIVGAENAMKKIATGDIITVDSKSGLIYSGKTRVM
ncbi:pyruvate kinase [Serpentinicella sp. ANB-PHB4]|uniref:pyruvate kinase n=1 Tax=Serpentinicella sp. ANB-PHB4 TaxID=3074076 RepID=UPI0028645743|nr:pyruvate kinase [Serpentinicella sp. ANB-PHB4]MDR5660032.1 pyruvate kinase [Serpentinicella sp. ANB-PHB4]